MSNFLAKNINIHFAKELPRDVNTKNISRQVSDACYSLADPIKPSNPEILHVSDLLLKEMDQSKDEIKTCLGVLSGAENVSGFEPYAMCYGGHQFGNWAGQLGDGRAINIAEADLNGKNWKFQLKGAGPTPYSRGSDGLAVLRSSIREYLCSEAMHSLGVPTTRALSLVKTGDLVTRDILYNGNPKKEQGAIVCRVSPSFIRFGSFQIFAARKDNENLKKLLDYTIKHHFSHLGEEARNKETYLNFFEEVTNRTLELILHWQRVGFVHGVMNTDNMSVLGLTIDYGPYGWLEDYNPYWTPNTTDAENKRYRFGNQANIALWNLVQLGNALFPLINEVEPLQKILEDFRDTFSIEYKKMMAKKLGLYQFGNVNQDFIDDLEDHLTRSEIDYTIFFRELSNSKGTDFEEFWNTIKKSSYLNEQELVLHIEMWTKWFNVYSKYLSDENLDAGDRMTKMKETNPKYVLRNYMAQLAIDDAEKGNYGLIDELYQLLLKPYDEQQDMDKWYAKRPEWAKHKVGCSMLSCSS
jgi:uncharacterized protein YdiU (UPF0061 family)